MIWRSGERGSGISVLAARHDNDDDDLQLYCYIHNVPVDACLDLLQLFHVSWIKYRILLEVK